MVYGHFLGIFRSFIVEMQGGVATWEKIISEAKCNAEFDDKVKYDDDLIERVVKLAQETIGLPKEPFLEMLGEFYFNALREKGHDQLLTNLGSNLLEFLQNLDSVHCLARHSFPDIVAPSFRCDDDSVADRMVLHYYSPRKGLYPVIKGFIVIAARKFFRMTLKMEVLSVVEEQVANENGEREHVTFNIIARKIKEQTVEEGPPTFIAQTKKHSEKQILQEDVEAVRRKLDQIKAELGDNATPLMKKRTAKAKWRMGAKIIAMHKGFVPNYPVTLPVNPRMFIEIFPFHIIFDTEMKVVQSGIKIQQMMPTIRSRSALMVDFFQLRYPLSTDMTYANIGHFVMSPFIMETNTERMEGEWKNRPCLTLKGQMFLLRDSGYYIYMSSPVAQNWDDLENRKMKLAEIPMWDVTRDFLVNDLECKKVIENNVRQSLAAIGNRPGDATAHGGGMDDAATKERIQKLQRDLDYERKRMNTLYQAFLPKDVIDMVQSGQPPCGEYHVQVTALFCDVVQFLPMVAKCNPGDVVKMLNNLYQKFDNITKEYNASRVESVGDAYLVIAGAGEKREGHAERIANTSLAMVAASEEIKSPLDNEALLVRIGIHTGSLVTGVLNQRIPRYIVMGETSVIASKLESHGEPGKIHTSPTTYRALQDKGFLFEERGGIELRGYGYVETYFLVGNEQIVDGERVGITSLPTESVNYVNETKREGSPFDKRNKIYPSQESPSSGSRPATSESDGASSQLLK